MVAIIDAVATFYLCSHADEKRRWWEKNMLLVRQINDIPPTHLSDGDNNTNKYDSNYYHPVMDDAEY